jgi:DNA-binding NarL/FixJ family response regulator
VEAERDLRYLGWAETAHKSLQLLKENQPDVLIIDVAVAVDPATEGIRYIRSICPDTEVILLAADPTLTDSTAAKAEGAAATLSKHASVAEILAVIRRLGPNGTSPPEISTPSGNGNEATRIVRELTPRELQVLELMGAGLDPRAIAKQLEITISTSRDYVKHILSKFGAHTQLEAVIKAFRIGLLKH